MSFARAIGTTLSVALLTGVNDDDYKPPFAFTGKLDKLTIKVDRPQLTPDDIKKLEAAQRNNKASE